MKSSVANNVRIFNFICIIFIVDVLWVVGSHSIVKRSSIIASNVEEYEIRKLYICTLELTYASRTHRRETSESGNKISAKVAPQISSGYFLLWKTPSELTFTRRLSG